MRPPPTGPNVGLEGSGTPDSHFIDSWMRFLELDAFRPSTWSFLQRNDVIFWHCVAELASEAAVRGQK